MRKHGFSIGLAVVTLGLILGLSNLRAAPASAPLGTPVTNARYRVHVQNLYQFLLLDTASGQVWRYNADRRPNPWEQVPMPPGLEGQNQPPAEKASK